MRNASLAALLLACLIGLALSKDRSSYDLVGQVGWLLVLSVVPAVALAVFRPQTSAVVAAAVIVALVPVSGNLLQNLRLDDHPTLRIHDGGVLATEAAARFALDGHNPYTADYRAALAPDHNPLREADGRVVQTNPLVAHHPYLPASFLVHVPLIAAADAVGTGYDPRALYLVMFALALLTLATWPGPAWARAGAIFIAGNAFVATHLAWGTNDAAAAALAIIAVRFMREQPVLVGLLLAVAVSLKPPIALALVPVAAAVVARGGWRDLRAQWSLPAALVVSCLPFFVAAPRAFVDDVVRFNLGVTDLHYPTSGLGLPAKYPDTVRGPVLVVVTLLFLAAAGAVVWWCARRRLAPPLALAAGALVLGLVLLTSRTFQQPYLTLLMTLVAPGWLAVCSQRTGAPAS